MKLFVLTREEKQVIVFIMLAILLGLGVKEYRRQNPPMSPAMPQNSSREFAASVGSAASSKTVAATLSPSGSPRARRSRKPRSTPSPSPMSQATPEESTSLFPNESNVSPPSTPQVTLPDER
jgi:hypothetical protein